MTLLDASRLGRLDGLRALRDYLAQSLDDGPNERDQAALALRLSKCLAEIDEIERDAARAAAQPASTADEIAARRDARRTAAADTASTVRR